MIQALTEADAIEYAAILERSDKGHEVDAMDLINALTWRGANQRREIHRLQLKLARLGKPAETIGKMDETIEDKALLKRIHELSRQALFERSHRSAAQAALSALSEINKITANA